MKKLIKLTDAQKRKKRKRKKKGKNVTLTVQDGTIGGGGKMRGR